MSKLNWWKSAYAVFLLCAATAIAATAIAAPAQTFTSLVDFNGTRGANPWTAPLVQGTNGSFYGTTLYGGSSNACSQGCGTVFRVGPDGALKTLHSFSGSDGNSPFAGLILASDGNFYGTTYGGGAINPCAGGSGCGTIFRITPQGTLTTLHSFDFYDGEFPEGGLVQGSDGNLYGTTTWGGQGAGTVFKISLSGGFTTLHVFNYTDGWQPVAALVEGTDGRFYGTTQDGGANSSGTVFRIASTGAFTLLHSFTRNYVDGANPTAPLIVGGDGNFYGTTYSGGTTDAGTVFRMSPAGNVDIMHSFMTADGWRPEAGLVLATDGNFYGTTLQGGAHLQGNIFVITPQGALRDLYDFCSQSECSDGGSPYAGLFQGTNGEFYGATAFGGARDAGGIYSLTVGLGPFIEMVPIIGRVGRTVGILGNNLTGATSVTFSGIAASFTVQSATAIKTAVPAGATTGTVQVVTPSGTLSSNVPFRVAP